MMFNDEKGDMNCFYSSPAMSTSSREVHSSSPASSRGTPPHGRAGDDLGDQTFFMDDYVNNAMKVVIIIKKK